MIEYVRAIWRLRYFWLALVRSDLRSRYRRSLLGVGWSLLHPIAMTVVLCTVFAKLFHADAVNYAPFVLAGLVTWSFLTAVMHGGCQCFFQGEPYIRQHPAPLAIYPLRVTLGAGIHFLLGLWVVILLVWAVQGFGNLRTLPCLLPAVILLFLLGWSLAVCMGVVNVLFQDTQHLMEVSLQILFYVTPIIYSDDLLRERGLGWIVAFNPVAAMMTLIRQPILEAQAPALTAVAVAAASTIGLAGIAAWTLWRVEHRMIFYL